MPLMKLDNLEYMHKMILNIDTMSLCVWRYWNAHFQS